MGSRILGILSSLLPLRGVYDSRPHCKSACLDATSCWLDLHSHFGLPQSAS